MAYKYREDLVGKRFLAVSGVTKINVNKVSEWGWKAGVIRAASLKDNKNKELQVLVEYDGVDWQRREWVAVYSRRTFRVFLVERTLVWAPKNIEGKEVKWPALTFTPLAADVTLQADSQPVEFLHDRQLQFLDYANLLPYQDWDSRHAGSEAGVDATTLAALSNEAAEWRTVQDGQRILTTTPSVLGGCRAQVYRVAGATQWYTAVIVGVNEHTGELTVTDDTVLEEHSEDPSLVQMRLLGDGVIESIMRGEVVGVMPRRSRSNLQRVDRESTKSPASTGGRKKAAVKSNGQLASAEPPPPQTVEEPDDKTFTISLTEELILKTESDTESMMDDESIMEQDDIVTPTTTSPQISIPEQSSSHNLLFQHLPREMINEEDLTKHTANAKRSTCRYCNVFGCLVNSTNRPDVTFFSIPIERKRRERWLQLIDREDLLERTSTHSICELHFQKEDICVNSTRKILKKTATPCLLLPKTRYMNNAVQVDSVKTSNVYVQTQKPIVSDMIVQTAKSLYNDTVRITKLQTQLAECRKQLRETQKNSKKAQIEMFHKLCDRFLSKQLSELVKAQTKLKNHNRGNRYSLTYKMFCMNLYQVSPQAYRLLENAFFLPRRKTLNRLYVPVSSEVNYDLMETLRVKVNNMSDLEKNCTVVVDTMWLTSSLFYNVTGDKIIGFREVDGVQSTVPASNALVLVVQGLFVQWMQPIGYALLSNNKNYKDDISEWIDKIITKLFGIELKVRAFVSNVELGLSEMAERKSVSIDRPFFIVNGIKVYYIFDSRQLLMQLRDNFLKYHVYYQANHIAKFEHVKKFYVYESRKNIKLAEKLTQSHINPSKKGKVSYATELFSKPVAAGLSTYVDFNLIESTATDTVKFLLMIHNLYDALNSVTLYDNDSQLAFYYEMLNLFQSFKLVNSKNGDDITENSKFIKEFQITIQSILYLIEDLKQEGHKRLLTSNLNLDQIKAFFDKVRAKDNFGEKPTSRQFVAAFRRLYFSNMFKGSKSGREDNMSKFLVKLSEFNHSSVSDTDNAQVDGYQFVSDKQQVNPINEVTSATYCQLQVPKDNSLCYITEFLVNKCVEKHTDCELLKSSIDPHQPLHNFFIPYIQSMDCKFRDALNTQNINPRIGMFLYEQIKTIPFTPPCTCFPMDYLQKLFTRTKIYLTIKSNNKSFRTHRNKKEMCFTVNNL